MPEEKLPHFTEKTRGADLLKAIEEAFAEDRQRRQEAIRHTAVMNVSALLNGPVRELLETLSQQPSEDQATLHRIATESITSDSLWLRALQGSVALDVVKMTAAKEHFSNLFAQTLPPRTQERFVKALDPLLDAEFKKMRTLKQAYYYRNRSVGAIQKFLSMSSEGKALLALPVTSKREARDWLEKVKDAFMDFHFGEKFTRSSYISEWNAFLLEAMPGLASANKDESKSFRTKIRSSLTTSKEGIDTSPIVRQAYHQLSRYVDLETSEGEFEFKAVKGEGLYAYYKPKNGDLKSIKDVEAQILAASFDEEDLPDISTQVVDSPGLLLVIKCLGKPNSAMIMRFEQFVRRAVGR